MKAMKKILAVLLTLTLVAALIPAAFADATHTITIENAVKGETYKAYKMFELKVDDEEAPTTYVYTIAEAWKSFFEGEDAAGAGFITVANGIVTGLTSSKDSDMIAFAQAAAAYAANLDPDITKTEPKTEGKDNEVEKCNLVISSVAANGYYLVTSTLGTQAMIDTTPANVTIKEKNPVDEIVKTVKEDSTGHYGKENDAEVGQLVEFKSVATIQPYTRNVFIHDTMDEGLTFTADSVVVYVGESTTTQLEAQYYEVLATPHTGDTFTVQIKDAYIKTLTAADQKLTLTYTATLNEKCIVTNEDDGLEIEAQVNETKITYGDKQSVEDRTETISHSFSVFKYYEKTVNGETKKTYLADAKFSLHRKGEEAAVSLIKIDVNTYRLAKSGETGAVTEFVSVEEGDIVILGVDSDEYYLIEEEAPDGYNKVNGQIEVEVNSDNSTCIEVKNTTGNVLPSTGGIGTTLFYVFGSILVIGAGVLLVSKKRMGAAE